MLNLMAADLVVETCAFLERHFIQRTLSAVSRQLRRLVRRELAAVPPHFSLNHVRVDLQRGKKVVQFQQILQDTFCATRPIAEMSEEFLAEITAYLRALEVEFVVDANDVVECLRLDASEERVIGALRKVWHGHRATVIFSGVYSIESLWPLLSLADAPFVKINFAHWDFGALCSALSKIPQIRYCLNLDINFENCAEDFHAFAPDEDAENNAHAIAEWLHAPEDVRFAAYRDDGTQRDIIIRMDRGPPFVWIKCHFLTK